MANILGLTGFLSTFSRFYKELPIYSFRLRGRYNQLNIREFNDFSIFVSEHFAGTVPDNAIQMSNSITLSRKSCVITI